MKAWFCPWDSAGLEPAESTFSDSLFQRVDNTDDSLCQKHHYKYVWEWLRVGERDFSSYTQEKKDWSHDWSQAAQCEGMSYTVSAQPQQQVLYTQCSLDLISNAQASLYTTSVLH